MEALIVIGVIIYIIKTVAGNAKKVNANRPGQHRPAQPLSTEPAELKSKPESELKSDPQPEPEAPNAWEKLAETLQTQLNPDFPGTPAGQPAEASHIEEPVSAQGMSREDAQGCIGGSLPHTAHEGEPRREAASSAAPVVRRHPSLGPAQLRQAVVWSEILSAPKALRGRRSA